METTSSFKARSSMDANQLQQTEAITFMDLACYNAAAKGNIQYFKDAHYPLDLLLTPNKNTILHIYITSLSNAFLEFIIKVSETIFSESLLDFFPLPLELFNAKPKSEETKFVEAILDICPLMLWQCNAKGETPFHIAARYGHAAIVEVLIRHAKALFTDLESQADVAKEMLGMTNQEEDTALHEAVRFNHLKVVRLLLKQDPSFSYSANKAGETLLYMAVERGYKYVTLEILDTCTSPPYIGPLGRTALHAAVFWNEEGIIKRMREKIGTLIPIADQKGWTPLHLAAYVNRWRVVTPLLEDNKEMAYMKDAEGKTALHLAAYRGNHRVVRSIISSCPDCCELVDSRGWNALHFSVEGESASLTVRTFLINPSLANLLNEKDTDGNTVLHHYFKSRNRHPLSLASHPRVDKLAFNNKNHNILDHVLLERGLEHYRGYEIRRLMRRNFGLGSSRRVVIHQDYIKKSENKEEDEGRGFESSVWEKSYEVHPVVAALVATVSFAAGITMPGGFVAQDGEDPGSAVLARSAAFKAFVVTDTLALLLSTLAVLCHTIRALPHCFTPAFQKDRRFCASLAYNCTYVALVAMFLAFVTGTYAVLARHYSNIAFATWIMGAFLIVIIWKVTRNNLSM